MPALRIAQGTRSGLWLTIAEGLRLLRPSLVFVENVAAIRRRGLDRVLGDLAELGYDASWISLRASDVGAPHRRERVFALAHRPEAKPLLEQVTRTQPEALPHSASERRTRCPAPPQAHEPRPTSRPERSGSYVLPALQLEHRADPLPRVDWGDYTTTVQRWEHILGRPAPYPTERGTHGQARLAPAFSEWLMGLPEGFVTGLGLPYGAQLHLLGNGVVPQQAEQALRLLVDLALTDGRIELPEEEQPSIADTGAIS